MTVGVYVVGDSISAQVASWPVLLEDQTTWTVVVNAVNGRSANGYTLPGDITEVADTNLAVYFLGTNDALGDLNPVPDMKVHLRTLKALGFQLYVVLPAIYSPYVTEMTAIRDKLYHTAVGSCAELIDMQDIWDESKTADTVHPLPALDQIIADHIEAALTP
jgi:hypothetical protein